MGREMLANCRGLVGEREGGGGKNSFARLAQNGCFYMENRPSSFVVTYGKVINF